MSLPPSITIDVPKDHPGLPRLIQAAMRLPDVTLVRDSGVSVAQKGLVHPGAIEEFFDALCPVVGEQTVDEIVERLELTKGIPYHDPNSLAQVVRRVSSILPLGALRHMLLPQQRT